MEMLQIDVVSLKTTIGYKFGERQLVDEALCERDLTKNIARQLFTMWYSFFTVDG